MHNVGGEKAEAFYKSDLFKRIIETNPITLVDVGARGGLIQKWAPLKKLIKVIGFEPDEDECRRLNETAKNFEVYLPIALFNKKGKIKLNVTRNPSCCSIFEPNDTLVDRFLEAEDLKITRSIDVNCNTLDEVIRTTDIKCIDFIKLDTQGSELQILQGAQDVLSKYDVFGIEVEVEFSPLYRDQPLFADVDSFLRGRGFTLFDIRVPLGRKIRKSVTNKSKYWQGQGLWTDALYFRDFLSAKSGCTEKLTRETAAKTLAIAELQGFGDFALELLDLYLSKKIFSDSEYDVIRSGLISFREGKFSPELKLCRNLKRTVGVFLEDRFPFIRKLIVKGPTRIVY